MKIILVVLSLLLVGCTIAPVVTGPTITPQPTATRVPTATPIPTATPAPAPTLVPTATPIPAPTLVPTATPIPAVATATPQPTPEVFAPFGQVLNAVTYLEAYGGNLAVGSHDLYTVPANRKAVVEPVFRRYNQGAGTVTVYPALKSGGSYYRLAPNSTVLTLTGSSVTLLQGIVLHAGESIAAITSVANGLNVWFSVREYSDTNALSRATLLAPGSGDNTLYTVTTGKSGNISVLDVGPVQVTPTIVCVNDTAGSINVIPYVIQSGGYCKRQH